MPEHLEATNRIFEEAVASKNFSLLESVYTKEARLLPPGTEMFTGVEEIKSFWETAITGLNVTSIKLSTVEHQHAGDTVIEIGRADLEIIGADEAMTVKYVVVWKQEDGAWKWDIDIWNPVK